MKTLTKLFSATAIAGLLATTAHAGSLHNTKWQTVDEKTGEKKAVIAMTESGGVVSGKIYSVANPAHAKAVCTPCKGALKNKPVIGLPILSGLKANGNNEWTDGKLVDPETGKTYSGKVNLSSDGQTLKLRGYVGSPVFGRTQVWKRVN